MIYFKLLKCKDNKKINNVTFNLHFVTLLLHLVKKLKQFWSKI